MGLFSTNLTALRSTLLGLPTTLKNGTGVPYSEKQGKSPLPPLKEGAVYKTFGMLSRVAGCSSSLFFSGPRGNFGDLGGWGFLGVSR